jgi:hypothetical protein
MQKPKKMLNVAILAAFAGAVIGCEQQKTTNPATQNADAAYTFERGYPSGDTAQKPTTKQI